MRICIDLTALADNLSGIERFAACISLEMIKAHPDDYILLFKREIHPIFIDVCGRNNVETVVLSECNKLLFNQIRLPRAMGKVKADFYLFLAFPAPIFMFKKNMIETIHDITMWDYPETIKGVMSWYFKISHQVALKKCKAIITISEFSRKRIHDRLKYPENKIWLIYCGIDKNQFIVHPEKFERIKEKYHLPDKYLLSLSTLEPRKNLPLLIHAYEELIIEGNNVLPLVLAGRKGWKMEELLSAIDDKVKEQLFFTDFVDDEDLPEVYALADFFVFPSIYEGFGMPPLEAMACKTPSICSDAASLPEVCGDAAIYFSNNDINSLKQALLKVDDINDETRMELISNGIKNINRFDWKNEAETLHKKIKSTLC